MAKNTKALLKTFWKKDGENKNFQIRIHTKDNIKMDFLMVKENMFGTMVIHIMDNFIKDIAMETEF